MSACEEESKRTYARLAKAEGDYDDALKANVTCNEELSRYLSYIGAATEGGEGGGGVPLSAASRLGRAVRHLHLGHGVYKGVCARYTIGRFQGL